MSVPDGYKGVVERVEAAARRAGRDPSEVTVVAISKGFPADVIGEAIAAGATDLGENRAQEFNQKLAVVGRNVRWHFVGHLQTNKVRLVVGRAALVHSVDRLGLAEAMARRARALGIDQAVLIEVNIGRDPARSGVEPAAALALAEAVASIEGLSVEGLMAMAPMGGPDAARPYFKEMAALKERLITLLPGAVELSMGMSGDFEAAVEEGATLVRVGEAIFGPRSQ